MSKTGVYLFFLIFLLMPGLNAQQKVVRAEVFSMENGLSQSRVTCMHLDKQGFLWIGTRDGLNRYDGYKFLKFNHQPKDTLTISNNHIRSITEDAIGNLWIATSGGLNRFDRHGGHFQNFTHDPNNPYSISDDLVYSVHMDKQGMIWAKTRNSLDKYDPGTQKFVSYRHYDNALNFVSGHSVSVILEDRKGDFWIGTKDGLNFFNKDLQLFERFSSQPGDPASIDSDQIRAIYQDKSGRLWIGTDQGLNMFDSGNKKFTRLSFIIPGGTSLKPGINQIIEIGDEYWLATDLGVFIYEPSTGKALPVEIKSISGGDIRLFPVTSILVDEAGLIWIGTFQGLARVDTKPGNFKLFQMGSEGPINLRSDLIASIYANDRELWLGYWGAGIDIFDRSKSSRLGFSSTSKQVSRKIPNDFVHSIVKDQMDNMVVGTRDGVLVFDREKEKFVSFHDFYHLDGEGHLFRNNRVYSIYKDSKGDLWFCTSNGLHVYRVLELRFDSYYHEQDFPKGLPHNTVYAVIQESENRYWVGTEYGLSYLNLLDSTFLTYRSRDQAVPNSLSSNAVYSLYIDKKNDLWVGTSSGLNYLVKETGGFVIYSEREGLPDNLIYNITGDKSGNLWLSTNKGLSCFLLDQQVFLNYDVSDGLQNHEFNFGAAFVSNNGEMFFGGISGFNSFYPDSIKANPNIPTIAFTSIELISRKGRESVYLSNRDTIRVPKWTNMFSMEFVSLDFTWPRKNQFAYSIQPKGKPVQWIFIGTRNSIAFSGIKPGIYDFRVKGSNNDLVWNEEGISTVLIVETPFWANPNALVFYVILGLLLVYGMLQYRTRSLRKSNKVLREKEIAARQLARQKEELTLKNKNITDSINYAKRIQEAMMPSSKLFRKILPESFVYHKPKDIVSGDFFWINEVGNRIFVAAVDCTGHGVPGAFMSIIGVELFRKVTHMDGVETADQILNLLNKEFESIFKDVDDITLRDGMDIAFCLIDKKAKTLEYSGAFNPLYLIRDNKILEYKGDRFSLGLDEKGTDSLLFHSERISLLPDDVFYIFSDGFADQFGGVEGKKFKYRRFRHLLLSIHRSPMEIQRQMLDENMIEWRGNNEQVDDILVIGIRPQFN
jgi:ligand-binding sensor domain-containing protein/serine phosphatase RsbU (regulator of sigma subunit)